MEFQELLVMYYRDGTPHSGCSASPPGPLAGQVLGMPRARGTDMIHSDFAFRAAAACRAVSPGQLQAVTVPVIGTVDCITNCQCVPVIHTQLVKFCASVAAKQLICSSSQRP